MRNNIGTLAPLVIMATLVGWPPAFAQDPFTPEVIFYNGKIVTANENFDIVQALAVREGKIVAVGTSELVRGLAGPTTRMVDFRGKTVLPGFYNAHVHVGASGEADVTLDWRHIDSKEALLEALANRVAEVPRGTWILARLQNERMPQHLLPVAKELDRVAPDHPVHIVRGHISLANSLAMRRADVSRATPDPVGGGMERDENGEPIGWFREGAGHRMIQKAIPPPPQRPVEEAIEDARQSFANLLRLGITSFNAPGMTPDQLKFAQWAYERYGDQLPRATIQLRLRPGYDAWDDPEEGVADAIKTIEGLGFYTGMGNDRIKLGAIKMSIDGGFSAAGFWTIPGYPNDPDYHGVIRIPEEIFYPVAKRAHDLGWQLGIHAIGDGAIQMVVDVIDRILTESPRPNHRHYIHHFSIKPPEETFRKMAAAGILVCSLPNFTYSLGPYNAAPAVTPEVLRTNNPQKSLRDHGIRVGYGSDGMPVDPRVGLYAAVTRKGVDGKVYGPEEAVSIEEAIRTYTAGSAYLTFDEDVKGTLEVGKYADMVVLGEDILTIDPDRLMEVPIEQTIVGGEVLYRSEEAP